jgi:integrase
VARQPGSVVEQLPEHLRENARELLLQLAVAAGAQQDGAVEAGEILKILDSDAREIAHTAFELGPDFLLYGFRVERVDGKQVVADSISVLSRRKQNGEIKLEVFAGDEFDCLRQLSSGEIDARANRVSDPRKRRPVGPRAVQKALKVLRQACRFGAHYRRRDGSFLLDADPTRGLELPSEANPTRVVADDELYEQLLSKADQVKMDGARSHLPELLILAADTGRRIGAIVQLRWSDWYPDEATYGALRWRADADKLGKEWKAPVAPDVREAIERLRRERPGLGDAFMFPAPRSGGHIRVDVAGRWLRKAEELAEIEHVKGFGWHSFRRMWASKRKHLSVKDVAAAGGWTDTATLERCYQHADPHTLEEVVLAGRTLRMRREG